MILLFLSPRAVTKWSTLVSSSLHCIWCVALHRQADSRKLWL